MNKTCRGMSAATIEEPSSIIHAEQKARVRGWWVLLKRKRRKGVERRLIWSAVTCGVAMLYRPVAVSPATRQLLLQV